MTQKKKKAVKTKKKVAAAKRGVGRPSEFKPEYCDQARKLALLGGKDKHIADFFGVDERTINRWKQDYPEFCQSMAEGKEIADATIAESLYHRAKGYSHPDVHVSNYQGEVTLTPITKHYPPDTPAASLWLRNRQPARWRDKIDHELAGKDGGPIEHKVVPMAPEDAYKAMLGG